MALKNVSSLKGLVAREDFDLTNKFIIINEENKIIIHYQCV